jgi:hypothetical protein
VAIGEMSLPAVATPAAGRARWPAILLIPCALAATWLGSGVGGGMVARFVIFEAFYVVLPGCLLYVLLSPDPGGWLRTVAIGWPLGYAIEVGAFALSAALSARWALTLLPLLSLLLAAPSLLRKARREQLRALYRPPRVTLELLPVALAVTAAAVLLAFTFFASSPLPEHARSVAYSEDNVFDVAIAVEARHHWPITEAWVAGEPLRYYLGVFIHAAALQQVVGIPPAGAFLRLLPSTMFLIAALQLWALGGTLGRSRWIGPLAAVLLLVTQDVNLDPLRLAVLQIDPFTQFPLSPSFAFGIPFFLGGLLLLQTRLVVPVGVARENTVGLLLMVGILVAALAYAKAFGAVDFVGGLGLYWLWRLARRRASRTLTLCVAVAGVAVLAIYFLAIAGGGSATMTVHPLAFLQEGNTLERATKVAKQVAGPSLYWLALAGGAVVLGVLALAPLLGAGWLLWREWRAAHRLPGAGRVLRAGWIPQSVELLLAVFVVGMGGYVLLAAPAGVEGVFFVYGYVALVPAAALGWVRLWSETPRAARLALLKAGVGLVALGVAVAGISGSIGLTGAARDAWLGLAYGTVAAVAVWAVWRIQRSYGAALSSRRVRVVASAILLLGALAVVKPVTLAGSGAWKTLVGKPTSVADTPSEYGMTAALYAGLEWVRGHTSPCDVLAVSNVWENAAKSESAYFYYPAFAERRVWLESWHYTPNGQAGAQPFPARFALNQSAIQQGDPAALRELARRGVKYVLIDNTHGGGAAEPSSASTLVYSSPAMDLYRLRPVPGAPRGCGVIS